MSDEDRRWLRQALAGWETARRQLLKVEYRPLPPIVTFDARCSYFSRGGKRSSPRWTAAAHHGQVTLPNGAHIPAGPHASNTAIDGRNVLVMSLPSVWRPVAPKSAIPLEPMLEAIMIHELTHAYQAVVSPSLSFPGLQSRLSLPDFSDDSIEERYARNPDYAREYKAGRDLLSRAAATPDSAEARNLACDALTRIRQRRVRYFTGQDAKWSDVDEVSLTTEGVANWLASAWLTRRHGLPPTIVRAQVAGASWSQDEGLALFLVIDRLVPDWQKLLLRPEPETAEPLLARACESRA